MSDQTKRGIPQEAYDLDYFCADCQGHESFGADGELPHRIQVSADLGDIQPGQMILDVGCGRGELECHAVSLGATIVGVDYAVAALDLAASILPEHDAGLVCANVRRLPFTGNTFDTVFALDIVEHLHQYELDEMYADLYRVLKPGGRMIVHTMPNIWYYRYAYPLYRVIQRLRGVNLPKDPRDRHRRVHVNEQSLASLRRDLREAGFQRKVYLENHQSFEHEPSQFVRGVYRFLATAYPFRWVFCNDLFAVATKPLGR